QRLLDQADAEARLPASRHPHDHAMRREIVGSIQHEIVRQLAAFHPLAEVEVAKLFVLAECALRRFVHGSTSSSRLVYMGMDARVHPTELAYIGLSSRASNIESTTPEEMVREHARAPGSNGPRRSATPSRMRILVHDFAGHPFQVQLSRSLARRGH